MNTNSPKYSDYLEVVDFPSEINPFSVKEDSFRWQDTFPHPTFVELLKAVDQMLGRANSSVKKNIWIQGSYGTGKSRIAWTIKTLLECTNEDLESYFAEYEALRKEKDLRDRLLAHKREKIVTVYRYASGEIGSIEDFIMAIYESTSQALEEANVPFSGGETLKGGILDWLQKPANQKYLADLIQEPEYRSLGGFAGQSVKDIIERLKSSGTQVSALIHDLQFLARKEGITMFSKDMDHLTAWLTDILEDEKNPLKAIVFVWDEFSEFFKKNKNSLDPFQKLAGLTNHLPFYLMIVTHESIFGDDGDQVGKKVRDRFIEKRIELPDSIAFDLIKHVIKVKPEQKDEWNICINGTKGAAGLKDLMGESCRAVSRVVWNDPQKGCSTLSGILPIHPMAALLLKYVSAHFASNQRSMFNFIKNNNADELEAFQWFIRTHSPHEQELLTIDFLWNFFYEKGTDDYGSAMGRSSLDTQIRTILDTYSLNQSQLNDAQKRILKTILMMQAISEKTGNALDLFLATEKNVGLAFEGLDWTEEMVRGLARQMVKMNILFEKSIGNGKTVFAAAAIAGDQLQVDANKKDKEKVLTAELVQWGGFANVLTLTLAQKSRFMISIVTSKNLTQTINRISNEDFGYRIPAVFAFARTNDESLSLRKAIQEAVKDERYRSIIFIDASSSQLSDGKFENWVNASAQEEYWRPKDKNLSANHQRQADGVLADWKKEIENGTFLVSWFGNRQGENCQSISAVKQALTSVVLKRFPTALDGVQTTEAMWNECSNSPKKIVELGIKETFGGCVPPSIRDRLKENEGLLEKFQQKMDALIQQNFKNDGRAAISDVFDLLIQNGFMPCNFYAYLTGWLLRKYVDDRYRVSDGEKSERMCVEKMSEIAAESIKHRYQPILRYREKYIEVLTSDQLAFVKFAHTVWQISDGQSIESVRTQIRGKLKQLNFPIWCLKYGECRGCEAFLDRLVSFANPDNSQGSSSSEIASELGKMLLQSPELEASLAELLTTESVRQGMNAFLEQYKGGELLQLAQKIGVSDVLHDVKELFRSDYLWLWNQEIGEEEIQKLSTDYRIVELSNQLLTQRTNSLDKCLEGWREKTRVLKISNQALVSEQPNLKEFLGFLKEIVLGTLSYENRPKFLSQLEEHASDFTDLFGERVAVFRKIYDFHLHSFQEEETAKLYAALPNDLFIKDKSDCENIVAQMAEKFEQEQTAYRLRQLWISLTETENPKDWSEKNRTPILIMVPEVLQEKAKRVFETLNRKMPEPSEIREAEDFLTSAPDFLKDLKDLTKINSAFQKLIVKKYALLLPDADEVRDALHSRTTVDYFDWYGSEAVNQTLEKMAHARYSLSGYAQVREKMDALNDSEIKTLLNWIVQNSVEAGIKILTEYRG